MEIRKYSSYWEKYQVSSDGTKHGKFLMYSKGRIVQEGYYNSGLKQGLWKYYKGKKLYMEVNYHKDKYHGDLVVFDSAGRVSSVDVYVHEIRRNRTEYKGKKIKEYWYGSFPAEILSHITTFVPNRNTVGNLLLAHRDFNPGCKVLNELKDKLTPRPIYICDIGRYLYSEEPTDVIDRYRGILSYN